MARPQQDPKEVGEIVTKNQRADGHRSGNAGGRQPGAIVSGSAPRVPDSPEAKEQTRRDRDGDEQDEPAVRGVIKRVRRRFPASHFQAEHAKEHAGNETDKRVTKRVWHPGVSNCSDPKKERGRGEKRDHIDGRDPTAGWTPGDSEPETDDEQERRSCDE